MNPITSPRQHLNSLTSLRFIFALMVFVSHLHFIRMDVFYKTLYEDYFEEGFMGVSFFFILSGFILSYNYYDKIIERAISYKKFLTARLARIYPLHFLTLLLALPLVEWGNHSLIYQFKLLVLQLGLLHAFIPLEDVYFSYNCPAWSISNEWFFYLFTPALIILIRKVVRTHFSLFALIASLAFIVIAVIQFTPSEYSLGIIYVNPLLRIMDFILGILLYRLYIRSSFLQDKPLWTSLMQLTSIILLGLCFSYHAEIPKPYRLSVYYWIPMALGVYSFAFQNGMISKLLNNRPMIYLGEISFAFYLFHQLVIRYYVEIDMNFLLENPVLLHVFLILAVTVLCSVLSFELYEKRMNRIVRAIGRNRKKVFQKY